MAPYAVAHLKLSLLLGQTRYDFHTDERLRIYLTNTLEEVHQLTNVPAFTRWLSEEADAASQVKQEKPVMVVMGNPPYSVTSANTGKWVTDLLRGRDTQTGMEVANYFEVDGGPLGERNPKMLNDDYVKFIRFAQWRIEQTGYGILAFITNHGYLDNPTFRGMRQSLMATFDDIYVLDLHGNSNKKEHAPDGSKDQNVFDIQQGVAIGVFVKRSAAKKDVALVRHGHLWGVREMHTQNSSGERVLSGGKYYWLGRHDVGDTSWTTLEPKSPSYLFIPQELMLKEEYEKWPSVSDIFESGSSCMNTARDSLVIDTDRIALSNRIERLVDEKEDPEQLACELGVKSTPWWNFKSALSDLRTTKSWQSLIIECLYRPFDQRWLFHHPDFIDRPRTQTNSHMRRRNLSLVTTRQTKEQFAAVATRLICGQHKIAAVYDRSYFFPLYLYTSEVSGDLFDRQPSDSVSKRRPNLRPEFIASITSGLKMTFLPDGNGDGVKSFGPEDVFDYMYAVFHSPTYRSRYAELLKMDFPRLPLASNAKLFHGLCRLGSFLVDLHLMERVVAQNITTYPVAGDNEVGKVQYTSPGGAGSAEGRVWINREQYFEAVPPEVWNFHVGGYQVCQKWLKDRKGRKLTYDDLTHYQHIVSALNETIRLMSEIDAVIDAHGGWPLTKNSL